MAPVEEIDLPTAPDVRHFTPPTSDESRDGRKALDDAGSSSELSDLEFDDDPAIDDVKMEDLPEEQPIEPDHYDGGIPVFKPVSTQAPSELPRFACDSAGAAFTSQVL